MMTVDRTKYMDSREVKQLRNEVENWHFKDSRAGRRTGVVTWAVVDTALSTGLRVAELVALRVGDFDGKRQALTVTRAKRRTTPKPETLAIGADLAQHLADFIAWKRTAGEPVKPTSPLFVGKRGPLSRRGLQLLWHSARERAGLPAELSIHSARHTLAVHLLRKTQNLRQVQKQLGHASPTTTANLYADVSFEDMQDGVTGLYD